MPSPNIIIVLPKDTDATRSPSVQLITRVVSSPSSQHHSISMRLRKNSTGISGARQMQTSPSVPRLCPVFSLYTLVIFYPKIQEDAGSTRHLDICLPPACPASPGQHLSTVESNSRGIGGSSPLPHAERKLQIGKCNLAESWHIYSNKKEF